MKKIFLAIILISSFAVASATESLQFGGTITRQLELEFNAEALEADAFITWALKGNWDQFTVTFNQGKLKGNLYTIKAKDYKSFVEGKEGIFLTLNPTSKTKGGQYSLVMEVIEVSENFDFDKSCLDLQIPVSYTALPPTPLWLTIVHALIIIFVLFHILWFAFLRKILYPKMAGVLQFSDGSTIKLNDCYNYILYTSHKKPGIAKTGILSEIYCGKKGSFQIPYPEEQRSDSKYVMIKPIKVRKGYLNILDKIQGIEFISNNKKLYHQEEYRFKDVNDDMVVNFVYDNERHQM